MNPQEVSYINGLVLSMWTPFNDLSREDAQHRLNNWVMSLDKTMTKEFAEGYIRRRYGTPGSREPRPGDLNYAWKGEVARSDRPQPCGGQMCDGHGWVNGKQGNGYLVAEKCPNCPPRIRVSGLHSVNDQEPPVPPTQEFYARWKELANRKRIT